MEDAVKTKKKKKKSLKKRNWTLDKKVFVS